MSDIFCRQVEQLLFYVTRNAISKDNVESKKVADINRGCYLKSRPENYDTDLFAFDGSLGTTTSIMSSSIAIICSTGLSSSSVGSGSVSRMSTQEQNLMVKKKKKLKRRKYRIIKVYIH